MAHEAAVEVIKYGFQEMGLKKIEAFTHVANEKSTRLFERLSFNRIGLPEKDTIGVMYKLINRTSSK